MRHWSRHDALERSVLTSGCAYSGVCMGGAGEVMYVHGVRREGEAEAGVGWWR